MNQRPPYLSMFGVMALILPGAALAQPGCQPLTTPDAFPSLAILLDSSALVASLPAHAAGGPDELVVSVIIGGTPSAQAMDSSSATPAGAVVVERVLATLRSTASAIAAFRVRARLASPGSVSAEPSVLCNPKQTGSNRGIALTVSPGAGRPPVTLNPRILIGANGEVSNVDLGTGTGNREMDRNIRQALQRQRYQPALLDGRPVPVWLQGGAATLVR